VTKKDSTPAPRKRGRPKKELDKEALKKDLADGATKQDAYGKHNLNSEYATRLEKKDRELGQKVKEGLQEFLDREVFPKKAFIVSAFWQKIAEGDTSAIIYGMKTVVGLKEGRSIEVNGEVNHIHTLDPAQRAERIKQLRAELETEVVDVAIEESVDDSK